MSNTHPAILCHGLLGWGPAEARGFPYWGTATIVESRLPRFEASVGPISSAHDRACELAFQIRGGQVDYGADHAAEAGHNRFGKTYGPDVAFHPNWSEASPVHLVGHSLGAPTIWMLQHLLADDFFGWGSNANWIRSITAISGVLNGSTATYFLGCDKKTGLIKEDSVADFLAGAIELGIRVTGDLFDRYYDFDLDHWNLESRHGDTLEQQLERIAASEMFRGEDNAAYSLTIQGAHKRNQTCRTHDDTFYFSYATEQTFEGFLTGHHYPEPLMNPFAIPTALYMGHKGFDQRFYDGFRSSDWWHNDGFVSVYSQLYPRIAGDHPVAGEIGSLRHFRPGAWYYDILKSVDHIDIVAMPEPAKIGRQIRFYRKLFDRLASL